jgi:hypothetical protein
MGQARLKREQLAKTPCSCGSGKAGGACCFDGRRFWRAPSIVRLRKPENALSIEGCYLNKTNSCRGKISNEHLISEAVLKVIQAKQLTASGLPWQRESPMNVGLNTLVANCLCEFHNSALSPLDTATGQFFEALQLADTSQSGRGFQILVSGHDIERWLLKTLFNFAYSKSLLNSGKPLLPLFYGTIDPISLLENAASWPASAGMYFIQNVGDRVTRNDEFALAPLSMRETNELIGMKISVQGLVFDLLLVPREITRSTNVPGAYRPESLSFIYKDYQNQVLLSWADDAPHAEVRLQFESTIPDQQIGRPTALQRFIES